VLEGHEQRQTLALAASERLLREAEAKLAELERYRQTYLQDFDQRAQGGMGADQARSYQAFLARLGQALDEQRALLARARTHHAEELRKWRAAARRSAALKRIVQRRDRTEQQRTERSEQAASDAHAQRLWTEKGARRGH